MNERLKMIRKQLGLNQKGMGEKINLSQTHISSLENGTREITDRIIHDLIRELNVSEHWLRTGEGEMFVESNSTIVSELTNEYNLDSIDQALVEHYINLDADDRQVIKGYVIGLAKKVASLEESATSEKVDPIKQEANDYYEELKAEEKGVTSSASDDTKGERKPG